MTGRVTQFINCSLVRDGAIIKEDLWVRDGKIIDPEKLYFDERKTADRVVDCKECLISPGFIDLQINGAFGYDFSDTSIYTADEYALSVVSRGILAHGVTAYCPTLITQAPKSYHEILSALSKRNEDHVDGKSGATILGIHLEGPFISAQKKGAHPIEFVKGSEIGSFQQVFDTYGQKLGNVAIVTLAPELDPHGTVTRELTRQKIVVSLGHSEAGLDQGEFAVSCGANFITHLFNAMLPFHHRDPGLVGLLASVNLRRKVFYGIIADDVHTHYTALKIAYKTHPSGLVLVTDAISAMGLPPGVVHRIGAQLVEIRDNKAFVVGTNTLCGSIATMDHCVRTVKKATGCSIVEAIEFATLHPAEVLGISSRKGTLNFETDADFILLTDELKVKSTYIAGKMVFNDERL